MFMCMKIEIILYVHMHVHVYVYLYIPFFFQTTNSSTLYTYICVLLFNIKPHLGCHFVVLLYNIPLYRYSLMEYYIDRYLNGFQFFVFRVFLNSYKHCFGNVIYIWFCIWVSIFEKWISISQISGSKSMCIYNFDTYTFHRRNMVRQEEHLGYKVKCQVLYFCILGSSLASP